MSDPILGITERWDTDALIELSHAILTLVVVRDAS
jgi:hypothetical protein